MDIKEIKKIKKSCKLKINKLNKEPKMNGFNKVDDDIYKLKQVIDNCNYLIDPRCGESYSSLYNMMLDGLYVPGGNCCFKNENTEDFLQKLSIIP